MKSVTVQIGNTDDKLRQIEWAHFVDAVGLAINGWAVVHFFGCSPGQAAWQNACWCAVVNNDDDVPRLKSQLTAIRKNYQQDSVAFLVGDTEFI